MEKFKILKIQNGPWVTDETGNFCLKAQDSGEILFIEQNNITFDASNYPILTQSGARLQFEEIQNMINENGGPILNDTSVEMVPGDGDPHLNEASTSSQRGWDHDGTLALIAAVEGRFDDMYHPTKKKTFWSCVGEEVQALGIFSDELKCKKKWENLIRTYKVTKDRKTKTGTGPTKFVFYDRLDKLLGDKPNNSSPHTVDVHVLSNRQDRGSLPLTTTTNPPTIPSTSMHANEEDPVDGNAAQQQGPLRKRKRTAAAEYVVLKRREEEKTEEFRNNLLATKRRRNELLERKLNVEERKVVALERIAELLETERN